MSSVAIAFAALPGPVRGALWMVLSCFLLALLAGIARHLSAHLPPLEIVFFRLFFALACIAPWAIWRGGAVLKTNRWRLYGLRAAISMLAMTSWFYAIALLPIGEVTAISFLAPVFTVAGAALILREQVGPRRWIATAIGFAGALVIVRPGVIEMTTGAWVALTSAVFMGVSALIIKTLARTEHPNLVVFYMSLFMTPMALVPALAVWEWPSADAWWWLAAMGPVATAGHLTMVRAFAAADASAVSPFDFSRLPFAVLVGWLAFGETIDAFTWLGAAVIFAATLYIARREARAARLKS